MRSKPVETGQTETYHKNDSVQLLLDDKQKKSGQIKESKCKTCDEVFQQHSKFKSHLRIHIRERLYL